MTDEQIINGIDVSGCQFIAKEDEYSSYDRVYKGQCRCSNEEMCKDHPNCFYKKALKQVDQLETEKEELKKQLQVQRAFTRHEQKLIYCVAYDETCKTGNDCKQEKCIFKDNIKLKQTLIEIKKIAIGVRNYAKDFTSKDIREEMDTILKIISEVENDRQN